MKILYVRRKDDIFLKGFLFAFQDQTIHILDQKNYALYEYKDSAFNEIFKLNINPKNKYISYLFRLLFGVYYMIKNKEHYDVVHILNIKRENFFLVPYFEKNSNKLLLTVYGRSTFLYKSKVLLFKSVIKKFNNIYFSNSGTLNEFKSVFNTNIHKLFVHKSPSIGFYYIGKFLFDKPKNFDQQKFSFEGINKQKIKIMCSTTIASYDNHFKIIDEIRNIQKKDNIQLIFMLTYGGTKENFNEIKQYIDNNLTGFDYLIIKDFLTYEQLAYIRCSTDILINMRSTDQLSGAMLESLYTGAITIVADWLNYKTLDDLNIKYEKVKDFNELLSKLEYVINNIDVLKSDYSAHNINILRNEMSFEICKSAFFQFYKD